MSEAINHASFDVSADQVPALQLIHSADTIPTATFRAIHQPISNPVPFSDAEILYFREVADSEAPVLIVSNLLQRLIEADNPANDSQEIQNAVIQTHDHYRARYDSVREGRPDRMLLIEEIYDPTENISHPALDLMAAINNRLGERRFVAERLVRMMLLTAGVKESTKS